MPSQTFDVQGPLDLRRTLAPLSRGPRDPTIRLAAGRAWLEIEHTLPGVAEGAYTVDSALALARRLEVEMPIAQEVHNALFEGKSVQRCLIDLLSRESKDELADFRLWVERLASPTGGPTV